MTLFSTVKSRLKKTIVQHRGHRGYVEGINGDELVGWAVSTDPARNPLRVGLFDASGRLLAEATASRHRADVEAAGFGDGRCGFAFTLTAPLLAAVRRNGSRIAVRLLDLPQHLLGTVILPGETPGGTEKGPDQGSKGELPPLSKRLFSDLLVLREYLERIATNPPDDTAPTLRQHKLLFADTDYINGGTLPHPLCAHQDYVRYRNRYNETFDTEIEAEARSYSRFYVDFFGPARNGLRIPLSRSAIDHFNETVQIDGHTFALTRATWSYLVDYPVLRNSMNFANPEWCFSICYWWSIHQCGALHVEDCLVPQHYIRTLSDIRPQWYSRRFPLTKFMGQWAKESAELSGLDLDNDESRETITLALMVRAVQRPDFLRYLPPASVSALLATDEDGECKLSKFARAQFPESENLPSFDANGYQTALRLAGYDLRTNAFLSITPEGHRFEAAMLPVPKGDKVDIQMIGPFQKASGLGQATRLSQLVMQNTPYSLNAVDFGLDNPSPEGFSRVGLLSSIRPARVNLIHLNAESVPLVFAYKPDVFSDAYNIGYFFWELDSPAACHFLGMDLLDEIWVSTEYGVSIYQPHSDRPVTNVGMCFEDLPEIDAKEARAFVARKCGVWPEEFVFLVAFDSFSFVQRKNPIGTIKAFLAAFKDEKGVRLIVKTQNRRKIADPVQLGIWKEIDTLIAGDSRITIIDETLTYDDLLMLKKGSDAYVSLHRSEGWGFGMIEAMNLKVPVVATGYSGNMEFCSDETAFLVDYKEVELQRGDYIFIRPGQKWAEPDLEDAARQMRLVRSDAALRNAKAEAAWQNVRENFSPEAISKRYESRLAEILTDRSKSKRKKS